MNKNSNNTFMLRMMNGCLYHSSIVIIIVNQNKLYKDNRFCYISELCLRYELYLIMECSHTRNDIIEC